MMSIHAVSKQRHNFDGFNSTTKDGELDVETEILKKLLNISGRVSLLLLLSRSILFLG